MLKLLYKNLNCYNLYKRIHFFRFLKAVSYKLLILRFLFIQLFGTVIQNLLNCKANITPLSLNVKVSFFEKSFESNFRAHLNKRLDKVSLRLSGLSVAHQGSKGLLETHRLRLIKLTRIIL